MIKNIKKNSNKQLSLTDGSYQEFFNEYYEDKENSRQLVVNWLSTMNFKYFITVTFSFNINKRERINQIKAILKMLNNRFFTKKQKKQGEFISGVISIEKDKKRGLHFHLLIQDHPVFKFKRNQDKDFPLIFKDCCQKMYLFDKSTINTEKGVDIQEFYSKHVINYVTKEYSQYNDFRFLYPIDRNGFSEND